MNALKGVSSRRYGQAGYPKPYGKDALWSPSRPRRELAYPLINTSKLFLNKST